MQALFDAIREACSSEAWSRGVELARGSAVHSAGGAPAPTKDELHLQVAIPGSAIAASVTLYPEDEDWDCDCASREEACEHAAAAVIAVRRARAAGDALPRSGDSIGRLRYQLSRHGSQGLAFEREIVTGERVVRLETTLDAIARGRVDGPAFTASQADIAVELALGARRRGPLDEATLRRLAEPLSRCEDVRLDGEPVRVSADPLRPVVRVDDAPGGFRVSTSEAEKVRESFASVGFALCEGVLRPRGSSGLSGRELHELRPGRIFSFDEAAHLVTDVLPSLEARLEVEIHTDRLPRTTRAERPQLRIETERRGSALSILATLVYGDPPLARIDAGRIVHVEGPVPVRDVPAERREIERLRTELGLVPGRRVELTGQDAIEFVERLESWRGIVHGEAQRAFHRTAALEPSLAIDGRRLDLSFRVVAAPGEDTSGRRASAEAVLRAWQRGESLVGLEGGGFAPLPADWLVKYGDRVADLLAARDERGEIATCALPDLGRLCEELDRPAPAALEALRPLVEGFEGIPHAPLPGDLRATLRDYQRLGVDWLCFLRDAGLGALLADDMGLGKTLQTLCALRGRCLVVAPTSVLSNWADEARRFRPALRVSTYHGPGRALDPEADLTLTSYAILRLDREGLAATPWDCVVLDEAQAIKNPESQAAQAAYALAAGFRVALTGTPVENRLEELWSQLHFLNRGLLGGRGDFRARTVTPISAGEASAAERLRERIRPFVLRRLKRDVATELPPRTDVVLHVTLSEQERRVYDAVRAAGLAEAMRALRGGGSVLPALEVLLRLRQAACDPSLVPGAKPEAARDTAPTTAGEPTAGEPTAGEPAADEPPSSKLSLLVERLEQAVEDDHRALVFSQWTSLLDRIEPALVQAGIAYERLDGSTRDRGGVVARFQTGRVPVLLVSLRAGGTGLNLTAADHVFLMDPWWNPAVEDQAADRAHRIGQVRPVVVHRLIAEETVEERILALHASKRALADAALGDGDGAGSLTREDLLALLD